MSDLNAIAHGVDSETGEYLTPQERKSLFKKGKMKSNINVGAFRSGVAGNQKSGDGGVGGGIVRITPVPVQDTSAIVSSEKGTVEKKESEPKRDYTKIREKFIEVESVFKKLVTVKSEKKRLHEKYLDSVQPTPKTRTTKKESGPMPMGKTINKGIAKASFNVFGMLGDLLQYYVLSWIGDPKNKKIVETFTTIFKHVASFFNWFVTGVVDNLLTGFAELVGGDSMLEKIGGFFKLVLGVVGLRWLLNPLKILKDLKNIFKFGKKFTKIFRGIFKLGDKGLKNSFGGILKLAGKAFRKTLGRMIQRVLLKVFGKAITKGMVAVTKTVVKSVGKVVRKIPAIGPLIGIAVDLAFGAPIDEALVRAAGALLGSALGATLAGTVGTILGSVLPVIGNLLLGKAAATAGGVLGSFAGEWIAVSIYKGVKGLFGGKKEEKKEDTPELASGGVVSGPEKGFLAILHGTEAVIPVAKIPEILTLPFKVLGSHILGSIFAVVDAMGSVGRFVKPIAISVLAPAMKLFGMETAVADKDIGKTQGNAETITNKINNEKEKQDLDKMFGKDVFKEIGEMLLIGGGSIFGSLFGGPAQAATSGGGGGGASGGAGGGAGNTPSGTTSSVSGQAGNMNKGAEMLRNAGVPDKGAAYLAGNIQQESSWNGQRDWGQVLGDGTSRNGGLVSWASWSDDPARLGKIEKYLGKNIKEASDGEQINAMLWEMKNYYPGAYKVFMDPNSTDQQLEKASYQYWGYGEVGERYHYAQQVLQHLQKSPKQTTPSATASATPGVTPTPLTLEQKSTMFQKASMPALSADTLTSAAHSIPEQKSTMFQKAGMPALSADTLTSAAHSIPAAQITPSTPSSASMPALSSSFSITQTLQSRQTNNQSIIATIKRGDNYNVMNATSMDLNNTSGLSETLVLNRI